MPLSASLGDASGCSVVITHPTLPSDIGGRDEPVVVVIDDGIVMGDSPFTDRVMDGVRVMSDSGREEHGMDSQLRNYAMRQSVIAPELKLGAPPENENHIAINGVQKFYHRTATHAVDLFVQVFPADAVSRRAVSWPGMAVEIVQANRRGRIDYRCCSALHMLVVYERGARYDGCTVIEGLPKATLRGCTGKLVFVPAGYKYQDWHEPRTLSRLVFFYFDPTRLATTPKGDSSSLLLAPRLFFEDSALMETARKVAESIENGGSDHRVYLEALGVVLAHELMRTNIARQSAEAPIRGGLAAWQRRKAVAYIEEHLAELISLAALAQLVGMSACYFCRAFRQSFGMPPRRYQLRQRIERAKVLLARRAESVTDVSLAVGYNDTSSFCTAFRRVTGVTASAYRHELG